jgi:hypothetical protein
MKCLGFRRLAEIVSDSTNETFPDCFDVIALMAQRCISQAV